MVLSTALVGSQTSKACSRVGPDDDAAVDSLTHEKFVEEFGLCLDIDHRQGIETVMDSESYRSTKPLPCRRTIWIQRDAKM